MNLQIAKVWQDVLRIIKSQLNAPTFKTWFSAIEPVELNQSHLVIAVPNDFARDWLEARYSSLISASLKEILGENIAVSFIIKPAVTQTPQKSETVAEKNPSSLITNGLNPKYTFDSFVIGSSNRFAHAAALAVAEKPAVAYNPLFIYGGVGLGKTHLLQAVAHYVLAHHNGLRVKYISTEKFTNEFINSIRDKNKIAGFQKRHRNNDVLLVDDVQFLENKEATQEEFFHTFNTLYEAGKQIVISSDRPPKDISTLEDRLRTRFESGLTVDVQPPDIETRIAILRKKTQAEKVSLKDEVLEYIASKIQSNIRELEGALIRVIAFSHLTKDEISVELAENVLKDILPAQADKQISLAKIQTEICRYYKINKSDLLSSKRVQNIVLPRQIGMYLARELTDLSLPKIGAEFGGRDHTTVLHAISKIEKLINEDRQIYNEIRDLTSIIKRLR
jgi:chromosomal replication initiator protein